MPTFSCKLLAGSRWNGMTWQLDERIQVCDLYKIRKLQRNYNHKLMMPRKKFEWLHAIVKCV